MGARPRSFSSQGPSVPKRKEGIGRSWVSGIPGHGRSAEGNRPVGRDNALETRSGTRTADPFPDYRWKFRDFDRWHWRLAYNQARPGV